MSQRISLFRRVALAAAPARLCRGGAGRHRDPVVARADRRQQRSHQRLAKRFNESQSDYKVNAVYKGSYPEAMAAAIAAYRAGNAPHILQVFEVGTATMMAAKGAIKPVYEVMAEARREVRPEGLRARRRRLLHESQGPDAVVAVQQLDDGVLVQQGRVREGGTRSQSRAADVAGSRRRDGQAQGVRARLSVHDRLADLDAARELLGVAQRRRSSPRRTASPAPTRSSCSTARCRSATSRTCRTGSRRATSSTAAARTSPRPSSTAASAR